MSSPHFPRNARPASTEGTAHRSGGRSGRRLTLTAFATLAVVASMLPLAPAALAAGNQAVQIDGVNDHGIFLGSAGSLGASQFTLELWLRRNSTGGVFVSTGSGGNTDSIPLITKGRSENDGGTLDTNYFFGIDASSFELEADFEDTASGLNHPVNGVTPVTPNVWHHAAATFNGSQLCVYLDGVLDGTCTATTTIPQFNSTQIPAIGTSTNSSGAVPPNDPEGAFAGAVDEVRIWNVAHSQAEIQASMNVELTSGTGLIGRWGLNEGSGTTTAGSVGGINGSLTAGTSWVAGAPALDPPPPPGGNQAVQIDGVNDHGIFLGSAGSLGASQFTLELWLRRNSTGGVFVSTGSGGNTDSIPLITKGRSENDGGTLDTNYFFGIDASSFELEADFEDTASGLNHPVNGVTPVTPNVWHHAAATFNGSQLCVYLDGVLDGTCTATTTIPQFNSTQIPAIGTSTNSSGAVPPNDPEGAFAGAVDEVRIWNVAHSQAEIQASMNVELTSGTGLIGRWGLNEGSGTTTAGSVGGINGSLTAGTSWVAGAPALDPPPPPGGNQAVQIDGVNDHGIFLGSAGSLGASQFTLELWLRRNSTGGVFVSTGSGGNTDSIPLITKGRSENDGGTLDTNYFFGIDASSFELEADFEDTASGLNHPVNGVTPVTPNVWHHAAATFNGSQLCVYLDGVLDGTCTATTTIPQFNSTQIPAIGTSTNSSGAVPPNDPEGAFAGAVDEVRIWNVAHSQAEIQASMNVELTSGTGLIGRWGLNEGSGTTTAGSVGGINGSLTAGTSWVAGAPLDIGDAPDAPVVVAPTSGATNVTLPVTLDVTATDPDSGELDVTFFGRQVGGAGAGQDFTIMTIPDTQYYSESAALSPIFAAQTQWIVNNQASLNTVFTTHLGDITQNFDAIEAEWQRATAHMATLDNAGLKNNVTTGNHDMNGSNANYYDQYFPPSRYEGFPWYGGYLGDPSDGIADGVNRLNKDNYELFSAGGMNFLIIHLEFDMPGYAVTWAQNVINAFPNRHVILSTHAFVNAASQRPSSPVSRVDGMSAQAVWTNLVAPNCQVFMVVNGHYHGEGRRTDNNNCGEPVFQLNSDYQERVNGGDGWLRYYTFQPSEDQIEAFSYSPTTNGGAGAFENDADSRFTLNWPMADAGTFTQIGAVNDIASGAHATVQWNGLNPGTEYEWYAVVSDGSQSTTGPTSTFTTEVPPPTPPVVDSVTINQATPRTNDILTLNVQSHDVNNDPITYLYQWLKNGANVGGNTATLNLATAGNGDKGDAISVRVTANDGSANSLPVTSSAVTILNSVPTATVGLTPTTPRPTQTVTATATRADVDGDTVTLGYVWKLNGTTVKTTAASSSLTDTLDLSTVGASNGNTLSVEVTPNDGTANGAMVSSSVTVDIPTVSAIPDSTYQADQRVNALLRVGNTIYIGGEFTLLLGHNGEVVPRQYLAAINATTGVPLPWNPVADWYVHSLAASPDGSRIYVGGAFRHMGGLTRTRLAAIDATTGAVLNWAPNASGNVRTIVTSGNNVYVGGGFSFLSSQARARLGVIDATTGAIGSWAPTAAGGAGNATPHDMIMTPDGRIIVVGTFTTMNAIASPYIAALNATTGAMLPWAGHPSHPSQSVSQGPGRVFIVTGNGGGGNQVISYDITNGNQQWAQTGDGDVVAVEYLDGVVYAGGHFDNMAGQPRGRLAAFDPGNGNLRNWTPSANTDVAVVTMTAGGSKLYIGGEFTVVSGVNQQRYASFSGAPAPNTAPVVDSVVIDQSSPGTNATLSATVTAHDPDSNPLTYAYQWTRNGTDIAGATSATLDMSVANRGDKGDLIRLRVTANDGLVNSPAVTSAPVTVANTVPTATVSLSTQSPGTNTTLTATATRADADAGDTVSLTYLWTVNGATRQTTTTTNLTDTFDLSVAGNGDPGDSVVVTVTPNDGTANGTGVSDTATVSTGATPPIFADEFANLNAWVSVTRITIDNAIGSPAAPSARANVIGQSAFAYRDLGSTTMTPCMSVNVNRTSGAADLFRLRTAANGAVIKAVVTATGTLQLRSDVSGATINSNVALGTGWHNVELCGTVGSNTTWDLLRDGVVIVNDWQANTGTTAVGRIQIGETAAKTFTFNFDHVRLDLVPGEGGGGDTQGPTTPGTPTGSSPSNGTIQISWSASTDASPPITYRIYRDGNPTSIGQTTSTSFSDPGLTPGTSHTYTVDAVDSLNNPSLMSGTSASITVTGPPDTQGPTTPGTPTGSSPSAGMIQIQWTASSDASPPITYRVYRDGNPTSIGQTTSLTFMDPGLTPGTSHTYTVDAVDSLNNPSLMSGASASITVSGGGTPPIFEDDFGTSDFSSWTSVTRLTIDNAIGSAAVPSARAQVTAQSAFAYEDLGTTTMTPCMSLNVNRTSGAADLFRLRTAANGPIIKAVVTAAGALQLRSDFGGTTINSGVALGTGWHSVELCGTVGTATTWTLYRDGVPVVTSWQANTGTIAVGRVQIGDTAAKTFTMNFDNVRLDQVAG